MVDERTTVQYGATARVDNPLAISKELTASKVFTLKGLCTECITKPSQGQVGFL
jgi:hypothetical protein